MLLLLLGLAPAVAAWQSPWGGGPLAAAVHIPPCRVGHEWEENFVTSNPEMETMRKMWGLPDFLCHAYTTCTGSQWEAKPPGVRNDRQCVPVSSCGAGERLREYP